MKIGVDATALVAQPTGVGNYIAALLEPMCLTHPETQFVLFSNSDVHFTALPNVRHRVSRPLRRGPIWQSTQLRSMLRQERPDVFWAANGLMPIWRPAGMVTLVTVHDLVYRFAPETLPLYSRWGRRLSQGMAARAADRIVAVSQATADDAARAYGRTPDAVIHPLANDRFRRPTSDVIASARIKFGLQAPYLLTLGTLEPRKNMVGLIDAYLSRRAAGVGLPTLVIAGGKGWLDGDIDSRLKRGESLGIVRRLGYVDLVDLPALFAGCETFLMPSLYEGFGMPLLEAQLCGAAVIHGSHASMREASAQLGVETPTDGPGLEAMFDAYASGSLPLASRLPRDIVNDAAAASERLWTLLTEGIAARCRLSS